jgi:hypothetical protein
MKDYSESLIKLKAMLHQYQKLVLQGKYDAAADVSVDMQIVLVDLQQWAEHQCTETPNS